MGERAGICTKRVAASFLIVHVKVIITCLLCPVQFWRKSCLVYVRGGACIHDERGQIHTDTIWTTVPPVKHLSAPLLQASIAVTMSNAYRWLPATRITDAEMLQGMHPRSPFRWPAAAPQHCTCASGRGTRQVEAGVSCSSKKERTSKLTGVIAPGITTELLSLYTRTLRPPSPRDEPQQRHARAPIPLVAADRR